MISKADALSRLSSLLGKELSSQNLHEALYCEEKDYKKRRRFHFGTHSYVSFVIHDENTNQPYVDIKIPGNPNTFRMEIAKENDQFVLISEPKIVFITDYRSI